MKYILTYGIACIETDSTRSELVAQIPNITTIRAEAEHLVKRLNKHQLSPEHLTDVIDDLLK